MKMDTDRFFRHLVSRQVCTQLREPGEAGSSLPHRSLLRLGLSSQFGFQAATHMHGQEFAWLGTIF